MQEISTLGYMVINASDLNQWENFATDVLGLCVGKATPEVLHLRMDERAQRIVVELGKEDDLVSLGWELDTSDALESYVERLRDRGVKVFDGGSELARARMVERVFFCSDPNGFRHEFFFGATYAPISQPFHSQVLAGPGFVTGRLGMGHALIVAKNYAESVRFYTDVLGLRLSDYIRDAEKIPGVVADATFFHTATGRHHSLATAAMPSKKILQHMMIQVESLDDVGLALDRVRKAGLPVVLDIGHHPNDRMLSFYMAAPSGFAIEYGWGGIVIDQDEWEVKNYSQLSDWGHRFMVSE